MPFKLVPPCRRILGGTREPHINDWQLHVIPAGRWVFGGKTEDTSRKLLLKLALPGCRIYWGTLKPHRNAWQCHLILLSRRFLGGSHKTRSNNWPVDLARVSVRFHLHIVGLLAI